MRLDDQSGLDALSTVRITQPVLPVIVITGFDSAEVRTRAAELRVAHVIPKGHSLERLCEVIAALGGVADGCRASMLTPGLRLSARKIRTLELLADGGTTAEIAKALGIGTRTAEEAIAWLEKRLGARNRPSLIMQAVRHGFLAPPREPEWRGTVP